MIQCNPLKSFIFSNRLRLYSGINRVQYIPIPVKWEDREKLKRHSPKWSHAESRVQPRAACVSRLLFAFCGADRSRVTPSRARTSKCRSIKVTVTTSGKGISISIICTMNRHRLPRAFVRFCCSRHGDSSLSGMDNVEWQRHVAVFTRLRLKIFEGFWSCRLCTLFDNVKVS